MKSDINKVLKIIDRADKIGLITHINGDGDAFGSLLGLRIVLELLGKEVVIFSNETLPRYLEYRQKEARYNPTDKYQKIDLLIGLDVGTKKRFTVPEIFNEAKLNNIQTLIIDHHASGDIYDEVDFAWRKTDISSTSEMTYWLAKEAKVTFNKSLAEFLLWGLETDTYFLSNPNVFETTEIARKALWGFGASTDDIKEHTKAVSPTSNKEFMEIVTGRIIEYKKENIIFTFVTGSDKERFGIHEPVSSAVANYLDFHRKPSVVIVAEQRTPTLAKVSMRSNHSDVDVSRVAHEFGGGGHVKAAGFEVEGTVESLIESKLFDNLIKNLNS